MRIDLDKDTITAEQFNALAPYDKGFVVYMCGARKDQPNVPKDYTYTDNVAYQKAYEIGQEAACIAVLDIEG